MADLAKLSTTLQESVLTLLAHDNVHGKIVARMVDPKLFEGDYRVVAERCIRYWDSQHRAPGAHLDDELDDILDDKRNRKAPTYRRIISAMNRLKEGMNTGYVMGRVQTFIRMQEIKDAIVTAAQRFEKPGADLDVEEVEKIFHEVLRRQKVSFDAGLRLSDYEAMLRHMDNADEFETGIKQLDDRYIVPARGTVMLFLGGAKRGKSWFLVNVGRRNLRRRKKVLHITLEMDAPVVSMRYYQSEFRMSKRQLYADGKIMPLRTRTLEFSGDDEEALEDPRKLIGFNYKDEYPEFTLDSPNVREELAVRVNRYSGRFDDLLIKRWAPRQLTEDILEAYLDSLEAIEGFLPDLCILDYIGLWRTEASNHRITLGRAFESFRGTMVRRNMAGVTAHQLSKLGDAALMAGGQHAAEDWSLIGTADSAITYSSTKWEFNYGLGRLFVDRAREEQDRFGLLMTQNYAIGQFCMESIYLPSHYWEMIEDAQGDNGDSSEGNGKSKGGGFAPPDEEDT